MKKICLIALTLATSLLIKLDAHAQSAPEYITNQPAPDFALKDMNGKTVSLADYKGKVVVLDFWATWCGPCKMSFPGMQLAVNKYKKDKDVQFLFIDTREKVDNYKDLVKAFLTDNQYTFKVLFDENGTEGIQNKFLKLYKVPGIPTKFIIDRKGVIRFERIGFMPNMTKEDLANEVAEMIEKAKKPNEGNNTANGR